MVVLVCKLDKQAAPCSMVGHLVCKFFVVLFGWQVFVVAFFVDAVLFKCLDDSFLCFCVACLSLVLFLFSHVS